MSFPTTFHQFPLLPVELKIKIWTLVIDDIGPRIVYVSDIPRSHQPEGRLPRTWMVDGVDVRTQDLDEADPPHQYRSKSTVPPLHVCRLSRDLTLKIYTRAFATHPTSSYVLFDFSKDILYVNMERQNFFGERTIRLKTTHILNGSVTSDCNRVKNFAIVFEGQRDRPTEPTPHDILTLGMGKCGHFDSVESIIMVHRQHAWNDVIDLIDTEWAEMAESLPLLRKKDISDGVLKRLLAIEYHTGSTFHNGLTYGDLFTQEGEARLAWLPKGSKGKTAKIHKRTITTRTIAQEFETLVNELKQARPEYWFSDKFRSSKWYS